MATVMAKIESVSKAKAAKIININGGEIMRSGSTGCRAESESEKRESESGASRLAMAGKRRENKRKKAWRLIAAKASCMA